MNRVDLIGRTTMGEREPVRHGRWKEVEQPFGWKDVACAECSECGEDYVLGDLCFDDIKYDFRYCPNCGAKMDIDTPTDPEAK